MTSTYNSENDDIQHLIEKIFLVLLSVLAFFTPLTITSQLIGISFHIYAILGCIGSILIVLGFSYYSFFPINYTKIRKSAFFLLILTAIICSALAAINHRKSSDDFFYIPNVVYMIEHPQEPMSFDIHFFEGGDQCELTSYSWGTSISYDYMRGAYAYVLGVDFLTLYFNFTSIIVSFLIPLALYYAVSIFINDPLQKAIGVFFTIGVTFLLCETHRTFGNFSITRAHQGKTFLLAVGIPFMIGISIRYLYSPSFNHWLVIFITSTAMIGATTSSVVLLPALGLVLSTSHIINQDEKRKSIINLIKYGSGFFSVALYALFLYISTNVDLGMNSPVNQSFPKTFKGHWLLMFNPNKPRSLQILIISTISSIFFLKGIKRRFLIGWIFSVILIFLNPITAPVIIKYITTPNIYWRLFYIYPFPIVLTITFSKIGQFLQSQNQRVKWASYIVITGMLFISFKSNFFLSVFRFNPKFYLPPGYKIPPDDISTANEIIKHTPKGPMLAPPELSGVIPIFSSNHPQMRIRKEEVALWISVCNRPAQVAKYRLGATTFAQGNTEYFHDFKLFLENENGITRSIVLLEDIIDERLIKLLNTYGYSQKYIDKDYQIYW